ncbi:hypothetical protein L3X38_039805 [Prunus dulcis]|uniref:glucan endo-1,3-beta-D-glucosidase n=1 Tax=Prunus dulcis TaxID=3755 RepID=A0AAD4V9A9_PRUDU|nr:hypothetical protein L3X38_039805 [Prunus dulcis]
MKKANLAGSQGAVNTWFAANVEPYVNDIVFNHIAVGNEVIPGSLVEHILPVMKYLQNVINDKNLDGIKVTIVLSGTALASSYPPSNGAFKPEASNVMSAILAFLSARGSPLMINVYPYFAYSSDPANIHLNYAQFTATTMEKAGGGGVGVVVSESGWPSDGNGDFTTPELARTYNRNFLKHITSKAGTPKRPGAYIEGYIFAMFTENQKPEGVEQHFGLFHPNMQPVYPVF